MGFYNETTGWNKDLIVENFVHTENEAQLRDSIELCIEKYGQLPGECEAAAGVHGCLDQLKKDFEVQVSSPLSTYESTAFVWWEQAHECLDSFWILWNFYSTPEMTLLQNLINVQELWNFQIVYFFNASVFGQ